jgi:hypothetical protein
MMVFSVPISLQIPLKLPDVCLMENSPFSKADFMNQKSVLVRWTLTRHFLASFSSAMNNRAGIDSSEIRI